MPERYVLDFEEPLRQIREKMREIEAWSEHDPDHAKIEIKRLVIHEKRLQREIYSNLTNWQRVQIARHPDRPYTLDYIDTMTTDFIELHGDRYAGDDPAMIAEDVAVGAEKAGKMRNRDLFIEPDRAKAIALAISVAEPNDVVLVTGKGSEQAMVVKGKKIPWDDREVVKNVLNRHYAHSRR